jgi:hypothetical protein
LNRALQYPTCRLLPEEARAILQRAASTHIPSNDPLARQKAIEDANRKVRNLFPEFFRKEY